MYQCFILEEITYLAQLSKGVIGLRSGLTEIFSQFDLSMHILYTETFGIEAEKFIKLYSLKEYPNANRKMIFEYDTMEYNENEIINKIIERIQNANFAENKK